MYLAPEPIKELEDWVLSVLRPVFPPSTYIIISYKEDEELEAVPYDYIKIIYTGINTTVNKDYSEQYFNFRIYYSSHLPSTMLPHRRCLAMVEKGRGALWEKLPPRPAQAYPLLLKAEKLAKSKTCDCGPAYYQDWQAYNRVSNILVPAGDPCQGAGEPGALLPSPDDYITPLPQNPGAEYIAPNPDYNPLNPIDNGVNNQYLYDPNTGLFTLNPNYDPNLPSIPGNTPFIVQRFIKSLSFTVLDKTSGESIYVSN